MGDCEFSPRWRAESILGGEGGPTRLVLLTDHEGDAIARSEVVVRTASARGWEEHPLVSPAPERLLNRGTGPRLDLTERYEDKWVVAHADRIVDSITCRPLIGQTVWTAANDWTPRTGNDALQMLVERGLWRMAGSDGWFVIAAQDDPFIPFESFTDAALRNNSNITLLTPQHGGHCGFVGRRVAGEDRYWAENRVMEFARMNSRRTQS